MPVIQHSEGLEGALLDGGVRVGRPVGSDRGLFWGESQPGADTPRNVFVRFLPEKPGEPMLERFLEATYLNHPNLIRCYSAGRHQRGSESLIYAILDPWQETLAQVLRSGPLSQHEVADLGRDLADALEYLHSQNLVCCALDVNSVVSAEGRVKISDYSQMRVASDTYATETRRLLAASPAVPPEAFEGIVTPAWDSWSLGTVLVAAVTDRRERDGEHRRGSHRDLDEPLRSIVGNCLVSDPERRCSVHRIREMLDGVAAAPVSDEPAEPAFDQPPATEPDSRQAEPVQYYTVHEGHTGRKPWWPWAAAGAAVGIGAMIAALTINSGSNEHPYHPVAPPPQVAEASKPEPSVPVPGQKAAVDDNGAADRGRESAGTSDEAQIRTLLNQWIQAQRTGNAGAQASFYAPKVDAYYGAHRVTRDWVRRNREQTLRQVGSIRMLNISNVRVNVDRHGRATVTLDKSWDFGNNYSGAVQQQLQLRKMGSDWRIVSERDTRVYRKNSGA